MSMTYPSEFDNIVAKAKADGRKMRVAIAGADVENILKGVFEAEADGFVEPILVGNYKRIQKMIYRLGFSDSEFDSRSRVKYDSPTSSRKCRRLRISVNSRLAIVRSCSVSCSSN